jgi:hypothetical protein
LIGGKVVKSKLGQNYHIIPIYNYLESVSLASLYSKEKNTKNKKTALSASSLVMQPFKDIQP